METKAHGIAVSLRSPPNILAVLPSRHCPSSSHTALETSQFLLQAIGWDLNGVLMGRQHRGRGATGEEPAERENQLRGRTGSAAKGDSWWWEVAVTASAAEACVSTAVLPCAVLVGPLCHSAGHCPVPQHISTWLRSGCTWLTLPIPWPYGPLTSSIALSSKLPASQDQSLDLTSPTDAAFLRSQCQASTPTAPSPLSR